MKPHIASCARWLAAGLALAASWALVSRFLAAPLIVKAYHGESAPLFNRIIEGQGRHGVDHYLSKWSYTSHHVVVVILAAAVAFCLVEFRRREKRIPLLDDMAGRDTLSVRDAVVFTLVAVGVAGFFSVLCSLLITAVNNPSLTEAAMAEGGIFQTTTFALLAFSTTFALATAVLQQSLRADFLLVSFLMVLYTARESDVSFMLMLGRPTDKWEPFFGGPYSISAKVGFALLIAATGLAIVALIWRKSVMRALVRREAWAVYGFVWSVMLASSQLLIDKSPVGVELGYFSFEEPFEMFAGAVCFLSVYSLAYRAAPELDLSRSVERVST